MPWSETAAAVRAGERASFGEKSEGRSVLFRPSGASSFEIDGVFTRPHAAVSSAASEATVTSHQATLGAVELSWFTQEITPDDKVELQGRLWRVTDALDDGEGGTALVLRDLGALP